MIKKAVLSLFLSGFLSSILVAQVTDTITVKDKISKKFSLHGYVDSYYSYNLNNPSNKNSFGTSGAGRAFYGRHNEFTIGVVQTKLEYNTKDVHIVGDLVYGPSAALMNYGNTGTSIFIKQAYIERKMTKKLYITMGQFGTHIGYEVFDSPDNVHYSLSSSFANNPYYHTGIKADYHLTKHIALMAGVVNGWDGITDNNNSKSIIAQASFLPLDGFEIYLNWMGGNEEPNTNNSKGVETDAFLQIFDLTSSFDINDHLSLGLNGSFGSNRIGKDSVNTSWGGIALYGNYEINDFLSFGIRGEIFDDTQEARNIKAYYEGITISSTISLSEGTFLIKPEFRIDNASKDIYYKGLNNNVTNSQSTIGLSVIGKF